MFKLSNTRHFLQGVVVQAPVIPAFGGLSQEDHHELETNVDYIVSKAATKPKN